MRKPTYINNKFASSFLPLFVRFLFGVLLKHLLSSSSVFQSKFTDHLTEVMYLHILTVAHIYTQIQEQLVKPTRYTHR